MVSVERCEIVPLCRCCSLAAERWRQALWLRCEGRGQEALVALYPLWEGQDSVNEGVGRCAGSEGGVVWSRG